MKKTAAVLLALVAVLGLTGTAEAGTNPPPVWTVTSPGPVLSPPVYHVHGGTPIVRPPHGTNAPAARVRSVGKCSL